MGHTHKTTIFTSIMLLAALAITTPASASTFDGQWNIQIASTNTACTSGTSVALGINNGQVASNSAMVSACRRCRRHQCHAVERDEARGWLRPVVRFIGIGHLARGVVLRHLDSAAKLIGAPQPGATLNSASVTCSIHVT
jgi:hypothetical protein